jgi:4-azaleucine resistance transporter AzlC
MAYSEHIRQGIKDLSPILPGVIPFGLITGVAATEAGLDVAHAVGFSTIVFAGASQLAAIALIGQSAQIVVIVLTALVINARFLMYSASLTAHFAGLSIPRRMFAAYLMTDQAYAFSITRYQDAEMTASEKLTYYVATGLTLWVPWQISTVFGAALGTGVPEEWQLDFAIPLVFLALLVPSIRDKADATAAATAGLLVLVAAGLPYNLALPIAAVAGIAAGVTFERRAHA